MLFRYKILYDIFSNRVSRIPIEYILKVKYFYEYRFFVFYPLLIPRNDTIKIVYIFLNFFSRFFIKYILDFGCGSGVLCVSLFNIVRLFRCIAVDKSYLNYNLSKFNSNLRVVLYFCCDWFYFFYGIKKFNIIISNPPYLSYCDLSYNFILCFFEYRNALLSNMSGFSDLSDIVMFSYDILFINGILLLEHSYSQSKNIRKIMFLYGFTNVCTFSDLTGLNRFTYAEK